MSASHRTDELKDRLECRTRVMQDVAHELKNPLTVIHGYANHLLSEPSTPPGTRRALQAILAHSERLIGLVSHLQDANRLDSGGFRVQPRRCAGADLLKDAAESAELEAAKRRVSLRWRGPLGRPLAVRADPHRVAQIFANLVGNALKFTPPGGAVELSAQREGSFVRFTVSDTGPGISAADLPHVFERFYQGGGAAALSQGLGLGLSICQGLVEAHGGRLWVESPPGRGARFHFTLPAAPEAP
jgi:two-component system phosphate regulon sensor histidine kinase PhoR